MFFEKDAFSHSPPFQGGVAAPLITRSRSLEAQTKWLVKGRGASLWKLRVALIILFEITNHPVCAAEERTFLLGRSHPY
jgi:hypothetical protein